MEDLLPHLLSNLCRAIHGVQDYHPPSQIRKVFLSSTAVFYEYSREGLIGTKTGCSVDNIGSDSTAKFKSKATLHFSEFRASVDEYFKNKTIRMGSKELVAVSIMYHLARWIQIADYEICIEVTEDGLFLMYGLAGPERNKLNEIALRNEDIRNV